MDTLYTFGDNITYYKTKSLHCLGPMNSATKTFCLHMALFVYVSSCVTSDRYMYFPRLLVRQLFAQDIRIYICVYIYI